MLPSSVNDSVRVVRRTSFAPRTRSSSVRRSLTTDFEIAKRCAAAVIDPVSAIEVKASTDSSLSIVRFFRKAKRPLSAIGGMVWKAIVQLQSHGCGTEDGSRTLEV